jgi:RND family efflux transporter MFP subunit
MTYRLLTAALAALLLVGCGDGSSSTDPSGSSGEQASGEQASSEHAGHDHSGETASNEESGATWTCSMHPQVEQSEPGQCPICGMDLVRKSSSTGDEGTIRVSPVTMQNTGVRTAAVEVEALTREIRTTGRLEVDARRQTAVSPKVSGWVERLYADYEGARVRRGAPLLEIYSPDLVATQEEYLLALRNARRLEGGAGAADAQRLLDAARRRLDYWDVSAQQIERLRETGTPTKTVTLQAPASGTVTQTAVTEGEQVRAGQTLMQITNLRRLWLMIDVYEQDLAWVDVGASVEVDLPYRPGDTRTGTVDYIYDEVDPQTRTVQARVVVNNTDGTLRPGMYATATLQGRETEPSPVVPSEAVLRTGDRNVVIEALGDGRFRPRPVKTGLETDGRIQILSGLSGGTQVVTSAQFLIDSEARLSNALAAMTPPDSVGAPTGGADDSSMAGSGTAGGGMAHGRAESASGRGEDVLSQEVDVRAADANGDGRVAQCPDAPHRIADAPGALPCPDAETRSIGAAQTVLHYAGYTHVPVDPAASDHDGDGIVYQDPMDWAVIHDAPGRCEVCGMKLQRVPLDEARANLKKAGYAVQP